MGISATVDAIGGWTVEPVVGRRPAGVARDAVHPGSGARAVLVVVDERYTGRDLPDPEEVARAAAVGSPVVVPMLDAGLLEDGTRWYVTAAAPGPVLDPSAGCLPRRAATIAQGVARALADVHAAGLVHGLVGPEAVVPASGRHAQAASAAAVASTLLLDTGVAPLVGDRATDLAAAAGVAVPADRGPAADVYALGALLLRMLTAAAPAGPALAALPADLRALLAAMLEEDPTGRPTAAAVARRLAGMREGLLATGALDLPPSGPLTRQAPVPREVPVARQAPVAQPVAQPVAREAPAPLAVPAPISAPRTLESPIVAPRSAPDPAPSLWTGALPVPSPGGVARPGRRRGARLLLLAGGVGVAGLLVGVVSHPPGGSRVQDAAVAAVAAPSSTIVPTRAAAATTATTPAPRAATPTTTRPVSPTAAPTAAKRVASATASARPTSAAPRSAAPESTASRTAESRPTTDGAASSASTARASSPAASTPTAASPTPTTPSATAAPTSTPAASSADPGPTAATPTAATTAVTDPTAPSQDPAPSAT